MPKASTNCLKLLIVEDDPLFGRALLEALDSPAYQVRLAKSGAEALNAISAEGFDLILQDIQLPPPAPLRCPGHDRLRHNRCGC